MIPYGARPRFGKTHNSDKCGVCSENKIKSGSFERREARKEIAKSIEWLDNMSYETHITLQTTKEDWENLKLDAPLYGWKTSKIDGDPLLGDGVKSYLTRHDRSYESAMKELVFMTDYLFSGGYKILRRKIENIVFDERL